MELFRQLASVCFVLGLAVLAAYSLRRGSVRAAFRALPLRGNTKRLRLIERLPLTPQNYLCVVQLDEREWLIAVSPNNVVVMDQKKLGSGSST